MIERKESKILNVPNRYEYQNNERAVYKNYDYYFAPIESTPFSLAVVIPSKYASGALKLNMTESANESSVSEYFTEENWKIHPNW